MYTDMGLPSGVRTRQSHSRLQNLQYLLSLLLFSISFKKIKLNQNYYYYFNQHNLSLFLLSLF